MIKRRENKAMALSITSMMDMFTIILVFLLKSFGSSSSSINMSENIKLPISDTVKAPDELITIIVNKDSVILDENVIVKHVNGKIPSRYLDKTGFKITPLFSKLSKYGSKAKFIASRNKKFEFDGKIILQMDRDLDFNFLRQIMYTAGQVGYNKFKFIAIKK